MWLQLWEKPAHTDLRMCEQHFHDPHSQCNTQPSWISVWTVYLLIATRHWGSYVLEWYISANDHYMLLLLRAGLWELVKSHEISPEPVAIASALQSPPDKGGFCGSTSAHYCFTSGSEMGRATPVYSGWRYVWILPPSIHDESLQHPDQLSKSVRQQGKESQW